MKIKIIGPNTGANVEEQVNKFVSEVEDKSLYKIVDIKYQCAGAGYHSAMVIYVGGP